MLAQVRAWRLWRTPPGGVFYACCVPPTLALLYSWSFPGFEFLFGLGALALLLAAAAVWAVRTGVLFVVRRRDRQPRVLVAVLIAPVAGLCLLTLGMLDVPLRARWAMSRPAFADAVAHLPAEPAVTTQHIGLYDITAVRRDGEAVLFHEKTGNFSDDAGFAYLPRGPVPELENGVFENPQFRHLGGPWYAWTASW